MGGLCGWSSGALAGAADPIVIDAMAAGISHYRPGAPRSASAACGAVAVAGAAADVFKDAERLVATWGPVRLEDAKLARLAERHGTAQALAEGFRSRGTDVLEALGGSFTLAIIDSTSNETILAIDRMGTRPLLYTALGETLVFGSSLGAISAFPAVAPQLDLQAIYDYVYFHMVPAPRTIYAGWHRLLPGTFVRWRKATAELRTYWQMRYIEDEKRPFPELKKHFLDVLRESVRGAAVVRATGTFLSGGTDSSTIAGILGDVTGEPARTYSIGFEAEGYDEMHYARLAARHFGTRHHEYYVTPEDVVAAIPKVAAVHDQPFGNASAVPTFYCAKLAKDDGIETLLGGDGGDELFGGNERYAKQYLYSLYSELPRTLRSGLIEPVVLRMPSVGLAGKVQRYMRNATEPMPARYDNYNLLERLGAANVFTAEFLSRVDQQAPHMQKAGAYADARAGSLINRMLALDLRYTLADNDLPKVVRSCELAGVDVRFPMLDDPVVAFAARLAPDMKLKRTHLRYFFKEALRDFLPSEIINKQKHGFGLPFGEWLREHSRLQQLAGDSLGDLKGRGIVRPAFIDQLLATHVADHPAYYGTMVWVLMMLEQWLQQHRHSKISWGP
jgi:asparagine synthase (glutamine-hydrolysing)